MPNVVVVYFSAQGHTHQLAEAVAEGARSIAGTSARADATLIYEPSPGRRKSLFPRTNDSLIIKKNQPPATLSIISLELL